MCRVAACDASPQSAPPPGRANEANKEYLFIAEIVFHDYVHWLRQGRPAPRVRRVAAWTRPQSAPTGITNEAGKTSRAVVKLNDHNESRTQFVPYRRTIPTYPPGLPVGVIVEWKRWKGHEQEVC